MVLLILLIIFVGGLYPKHLECQEFYDAVALQHASVMPEQTQTTVLPGWIIVAECQGVENNLYLSYYFLALGIALIAAGYVVRR